MTEADSIEVTVVHGLPERYWSVVVRLPAQATVDDALRAADPAAQGIEVAADRLAVFGRTVTPASGLHDGDRVEILRPLLIDPKEGRRLRAGADRRK